MLGTFSKSPRLNGAIFTDNCPCGTPHYIPTLNLGLRFIVYILRWCIL